jgi:hypothetical protein
VQFRGLPDDRQAQPGTRPPARGRRAVEAVEYEREVSVRDPGTLVRDDDLPVADRQINVPVGRAPSNGVVKEVPDRAIEHLGIAPHSARR